MMLFQALFLLAFWRGVYLLHEQTTLIVAAEKKAREREEAERERLASTIKNRGLEKWISAAGDGAILEFTAEEIILSRNGQRLFRSCYWQSKYSPHESVEIGHLRRYCLPYDYRITPSQFKLWCGRLFEELGIIPNVDGAVTFNRLKE